MRKLKVYATINENVWLTKITKLPTMPFIFMAKIWKKTWIWTTFMCWGFIIFQS